MKVILFLIFITVLKSQGLVQSEQDKFYYCNSSIDINICPPFKKPVCAVNQDGVFQTYVNACQACQTKGIKGYYLGICEQKCYDTKPACSDKEDTVCGYYDSTINCFVQPCAKQFLNRCLACSSDNIAYTIRGKCPSIIPKQFKCQRDNDISLECPDVYKPVCGYYYPGSIVCKKEPCAKTFGNSCYVCKDKNIEYYVEGECE